VLSAPERFEQDLTGAQKRFYELSRALHPDRFVRSERAVKQASLERMSLINEAFEFLKSPEQLREHFFSKFGVSCGGGGGLMIMELSERWFEVQEGDDPVAISEFEEELLQKKDFLDSKIKGLEVRFDTLADASTNGDGQRRQVLEEIQSLGLSQNTLKSLIRDVQRLKARLGLG